jgi:hypothetical protein
MTLTSDFELHEQESHIEEFEGDILVPRDWVDETSWSEEAPVLDETQGEAIDYSIYDGIADAYQDETPEVSPETSGRSAAELQEQRRTRQSNLLKKEGFLASSMGEINHAEGLIAHSHDVGRAAKYLAIITQHQKNGVRIDGEPIDTDDPEAAARSIATEFGNYGQNARGEKQGMLELRAFLRRFDHLPTNTPLVEAQPLKEWIIEDWSHRALADLLRYTDTLGFIDGGDEHTSDKYLTDDPAMKERLESFITALTLGQTNELATERYHQQSERLSFWTQQIVAAHKFSSGRLKATLRKQLSRVGRSAEETN